MWRGAKLHKPEYTANGDEIMENDSRLRNSGRNLFFGVGNQIVLLLLSFISRTIFIHILGAEYLGIHGLYTNILTVLSLAELGVGSAMVYSMYSPLAQRNEEKLAALMHYYRKLYRIIGATVAAGGLLLLPFIRYFVKTQEPVAHLALYYLLFLANAVLSYPLAYKASILEADQKRYLITLYSFIFMVLRFVLQTIILWVTHNFVFYLIVQILCTVLNNIYIARRADRMYPFLTQRAVLGKEEKKEIFSNIKSMFVYKAGGVFLNHTDNILISVILGTIWVGYYSNYSMITQAIATFTGVIFASLYASVGNLNACADRAKAYRVFQNLNFLSFWIFGFCSLCFLMLLNPFVRLWLGEAYVLDFQTVLSLVLTFYVAGVLNPVIMYRETTGIFRKTKYIILFTAVLNLVLSIVLGYLWGLAGILLATALARLCTNFWYEPCVLYRDYFHRKPTQYFREQAGRLLLLLVTGVIVSALCALLRPSGIGAFLGKCLICLLVPNAVFAVALRKTQEFQYFKEIIIRAAKRTVLHRR